MTDDQIEAVIAACGPGMTALVESAFQHDLLWLNMASFCGLTAAQMPVVRAYIRAFYSEDGEPRTRPTSLLGRS